MTNPLSVCHYPVFEKGIFEKNPSLFDWFIQQTPDHFTERYHKSLESLRKYEGTITWPVVTGPGFCGATHPGSSNIFVATMGRSSARIYNSDCLYVNPAHRVFAVSDAPGITTFSREMFAELDRGLRETGVGDLEAIVNRLNKELNTGNRATLSLVCFPGDGGGSAPSEVVAFVAGDTYLFRGNMVSRTLTRVLGSPEFMGTPHVDFRPLTSPLCEGDFFIIVSDGIDCIRALGDEMEIEKLLMNNVNGDLEKFAFDVITNCNRSFEDRLYDKAVTRFGGGDNVSALLVYPEKLPDTGAGESVILGGFVGEASQMR